MPGGGLATLIRRQSGQVGRDAIASHVPTHWAWNPCPQHGMKRASPPSSSPARHTAHSTSPSFERAAARYTVAAAAGVERRDSGSPSRPRRGALCEEDDDNAKAAERRRRWHATKQYCR